MLGSRALEICEPAPFIYYENGQIAVTDGTAVWLVIVTCEAMQASASPPEKSLRRLLRYADLYRRLAAEAIDRQEDVDGKVWVTEAMVRAAMLPRLARSPGASRSKPTRGEVHAQLGS